MLITLVKNKPIFNNTSMDIAMKCKIKRVPKLVIPQLLIWWLYQGGIFVICFLFLLHFYLMCNVTGVCHFCAHLYLLVLQIDGNNLYLELYRLNNIIVQSLNTWKRGQTSRTSSIIIITIRQTFKSYML